MAMKCRTVHSSRRRRLCKASNLCKCNRSLNRLSKWQLRRVESALNASANLCETISRNIFESDSQEVVYNKVRCSPLSRDLHELRRWELKRVNSALNAAANLCASTSRDIVSDLQVYSKKRLMQKPFICRCLALTLTVLYYLQDKNRQDRDEGTSG